MSENNGAEPGSNVAQFPNELLQLRDILFGEDKREFQAHFQSLEHKTEKRLDELTSNINNEIAELREVMESQFAKLSERLADVDHLHDERANKLSEHIDHTLTKLESFEQATEQTTQHNLAQLSTSIEKLNTDLTTKHEQALEKITQVAESLSSDKADRNMLSSILIDAAQKIAQDNG